MIRLSSILKVSMRDKNKMSIDTLLHSSGNLRKMNMSCSSLDCRYNPLNRTGKRLVSDRRKRGDEKEGRDNRLLRQRLGVCTTCRNFSKIRRGAKKKGRLASLTSLASLASGDYLTVKSENSYTSSPYQQKMYLRDYAQEYRRKVGYLG